MSSLLELLLGDLGSVESAWLVMMDTTDFAGLAGVPTPKTSRTCPGLQGEWLRGPCSIEFLVCSLAAGPERIKIKNPLQNVPCLKSILDLLFAFSKTFEMFDMFDMLDVLDAVTKSDNL